MYIELKPRTSHLYKLEMGIGQALWHHLPAQVACWLCVVSCMWGRMHNASVVQAWGGAALCMLGLTVLLGWGPMGRAERLLWATYFLVMGTALGLLAANALPPLFVPPPQPQTIFSSANVSLALGMWCLHAWARGGAARVWLFGGIVVPYLGLVGYVAHKVGALLPAACGSRLAPVPVCFAVALGCVLYLAFLQVWGMRLGLSHLRRSSLLSALWAATAASVWVVPLDILAQAMGLWQWSPSLPRVALQAPFLLPLVGATSTFCLSYVLFGREQAQRLLPGGPLPGAHRAYVLWRLPLCWFWTALLSALVVWLCEGSGGPSFALARLAVQR